ncbi:glycine rich domain-containing protein [Clostridium saccharoperbutylacetonicum]
MVIKQFDFAYTGEVQTFVIPYSGYYDLQVWGAQGGSRNNNGGMGGYSKGHLFLTKAQILYVYVGACPNYNTTWNGGGYSVYPGGDASDIRIGGKALTNRIIVAGGGGGTGYGPGTTWNYVGGVGGGVTGGNGQGGVGYYGFGGTQTAGGARGTYIESNWYNQAGSFGQGGNCVSNSYGGGGGGGWYGGGCGECGSGNDGGGGGGSGYIGGVLNGTMQSGVNAGNGKVMIRYCSQSTILLQKDNKLYIPDKAHFNIYSKEFKEATIDEITVLCKDWEATFPSLQSMLNPTFEYNKEMYTSSDIIDFTKYKICVFTTEKMAGMDITFNPTQASLDKTEIKIKDKFIPFTDKLHNAFIDIITLDKTKLSYRMFYDIYGAIDYKKADLLYQEILKGDFNIWFKLNDKASILESIILYGRSSNNYIEIKDDDYLMQVDFINTYVTFNYDNKEVLINRINKESFKLTDSSLEKF